MGRILNIWRGWSRNQRLVFVGSLVTVVAGGAVAAYLLLKRDSDVGCPPPCALEVEAEPVEEPKKEAKRLNWPVYGYTDQRTRYFPTKKVKPPYAASRWSFNAGTLLEFSPVLVDDRLYIVDKNAVAYALDARKGKVLWKRDVGGLSAASPAFADGRLFVVSLEPGDVQALNPRNGKVLWERDLGARSETSPVIFRDKVIVGNESGTVFALDVKTGNTEWSVDSAGAVKGGVAIDDGHVYFGNYAGEVFSIDAKNGEVKWQTGTQGGSFGRTGRIYSTPTVGYGRVYLGSIDSRVYSFNQEDGSLAWSQSTGAEVYSGPALAETPGAPATVFIGSADKYFYALDARTGAIRWKQFTEGIILGAASVIGDVAYVGIIGPMNGTIGYDAKTGKEVFRHDLGEYNPAITDGHWLYLTGASILRAFPPELSKKQKAKQRREARQRAADRRAEEAAGETPSEEDGTPEPQE